MNKSKMQNIVKRFIELHNDDYRQMLNCMKPEDVYSQFIIGAHNVKVVKPYGSEEFQKLLEIEIPYYQSKYEIDASFNWADEEYLAEKDMESRQLTREEKDCQLRPKKDMVHNPTHYTSHPSGVECIEITEHMTFCIGNAIKYLWRCGLKGDSKIEDLEKARWYIDREIKRRIGGNHDKKNS